MRVKHVRSQKVGIVPSVLQWQYAAAQQFFCNFRAGCGTGSSLFGVAPRLVLKYNIRPGLSQAGFLVSLARSCASR